MTVRRLFPAVFVLILLLGDATSQTFGSPNRAQTISNIFQIPIQTLTAISNFAQNTRPLGEILQRRRPQQIQQFPGSSSPSQPLPTNNLYRSRAAQIAGLYIARDGSGFRI